jgi:oxygen-dependent protoporphyrinogen oxidase
MTVGIVGAGITGLALTHYLDARGVDVVTFEAASEPGGAIDSRRVDGHVLECGPQRVRLTDEISDMVDDLGLREELLVADDELPLYVYVDGRLREVPRSIPAFLRTDLLSWPGKLRLLAEPLTGDGDPDETAAELFTRKFGGEAYHNLIGPLFGGIYGSDPARMPAKHALSGLLRMEAKHGNLLQPALKRVRSGGETPPPISFLDGMQQLPEALYAAHDDSVELETPVEAVRTDGDGYVLETPGESVRVDDVVVTVRADRAAALLADVDADSAAALDELDYNSLVYVHLLADVDRAGFGYQVRRDEPLQTLGVSWNDSLFDAASASRSAALDGSAGERTTRQTGREGVYTVFLGGMDHPEAMEWSAERQGRVAAEEFEDVMGAPAEVLNVTPIPDAFPAWDESWSVLDRVSLPDGATLATNYTARMGVPSRIREAKRLAGELADRDGTRADAATVGN